MHSAKKTFIERLLKRIIFIVLLSSLGISKVFPQDNYRVFYLANNPQLPSNLIKSVEQDNEGYIWIATDGGLVRYDGENFKMYNTVYNSKYIKSFYKYKDTIFVITDDGICKIVRQNNQHVILPFLKGAAIKSDSLVFYPKALFVDKNKNIWISEPSSVLKVNVNGLKRYNFQAQDYTQSYSRSFIFAEDKKGTLLVTSQTGRLFYYNTHDDKFINIPFYNKAINNFDAMFISRDGEILAGGKLGVYKITVNDNYSSADIFQVSNVNNISSITQDQDGNFFVGSWTAGLYKTKSFNNKLQKVSILNFDNISNIKICNDGNIWISSDEGLAYLYPTFFGQVNFTSNSYYIESLIKTRKNVILTSNGYNVFEILNSTAGVNAKIIYSAKESLIRSLAGEPDNLWIGFSDGFLINYKNGVSKKIDLIRKDSRKDVVYYIQVDKNGQAWVAQEIFKGLTRIDKNYNLKYYDAAKGLNAGLNVVKESPSGELYCAGVGNKNYLFRYNSATDSFLNISAPINFNLNNNNLEINDIDFDRNGSIWLASNYGLLKYSNNKIKRIKSINLSKSGIMKSIAVDSENNIWLGMEYGLAYYHQSGYSVIFDKLEGLSNLTMTYRTAVVDNQNKVWSGSVHGLSYLLKGFNNKLKTPAPVFTYVISNDELINKNSVYELKYHSSLNVKFNSLTYPGYSTFYQYKIKNITNGWSKPELNNYIYIPKLEAGDYKIEVRALKTGYLWSNISEISIKVNTPFYLSFYAIILYALFTLGLIIFIYIFYSEKKERKKLSDQLNHFFKTSNDILLITNDEGKLIYVNPFGQSFLSVSNENYNNNFVSLFPQSEIPVVEEKLSELRKTKTSIAFTVRIKNKSGNEFVYQWNISASSKFKRFYLIGSDITEIKNMQTQMSKYIEELKEVNNNIEIKSKELINLNEKLQLSEKSLTELNANKDKFFSIIAHDLRSPFTGLLGFTELLIGNINEFTTEELSETINQFHSNLTNLFTLLKNLLEWAQVQQNNISFNPAEINLSQKINFSINLISSLADKKEIKVLTNIPNNHVVIADEPMLNSILSNLLSNAIKFTKHGGTITVTSKTINNNLLEVSITDNGIGMSQTLVNNLFKINEKVGRTGTEGEQSTGIGLILCKELVEKNGGAIKVISQENIGSTFIFSLPSKSTDL